ncbi:Gfo/Idh/MocA family protein [Limobrevibacterium gyesilva]|uniref:Gfo/Idh/MocA family oxidoreductase n=1 Tax=Limobrevibacterium gyesilva TaxID=2991712 RepID=A0AA42CDD5_9PROT|nr:Gfo/Idh/MocA family oxidoreductase [Limobrevibacterium gyesilva]MCW3474723.1 Gfo/Idh/MocA family oxidoreductase [Limobrevibacterium gyesilva]
MIGLGIIGAGIMGERLVRAALEQAADSVRIVGIWDPAPAAMARMAQEFPAIARAASPEALTAAADCVYVASPPASHLEHAGRTVAAGKALFCEKPLAVDVAAARAFVAGAAGKRAAVNFPFASSFAVQRLREWIDQGVIGTPRSLVIEVAFAAWPRSWQRDAAGWLDGRAQGGFTREVVSHFLFLSRRALGALALHAHTASFPEAGRSERAITATLSAGGLPATLTGGVGTTGKDDHNTWTLTGDKGAIRLRDWSIAERLVDGAWQPDPEALPNERMRPLVLKRQLAGVAAMTRGEPHHLATLEEAFEVQSVVEAILAP